MGKLFQLEQPKSEIAESIVIESEPDLPKPKDTVTFEREIQANLWNAEMVLADFNQHQNDPEPEGMVLEV